MHVPKVCSGLFGMCTYHRDLYAIAIAIAHTNVPLSSARLLTSFVHPQILSLTQNWSLSEQFSYSMTLLPHSNIQGYILIFLVENMFTTFSSNVWH